MKIPLCLFMFFIGMLFYAYVIKDLVIDNRANNYGVMKYDSKLDKMKYTNQNLYWYMYYIKNGKMK